MARPRDLWVAVGLLVFASIAFGQKTSVAGLPGDVVSVQLSGLAKDTKVSATAPSLVTFLGASAPNRDGQSTVTFLIQSDALAGSYQAELIPSSAASTTPPAPVAVTIVVKAAPKVALSITGPSFVKAGSTARLSIHITNTGNIADQYTITSQGGGPTTLGKDHVSLKPGESTAVALTTTPLQLGDQAIIVQARSNVDAAYVKSVLFDISVLALGTTDPNAPFLAYTLPLGATYGSQGLTYHAGLSLGGKLSSLVNMQDSFAVTPGTSSASVGFFGDNWGVTYSYDPSQGHSAFVESGPWTANGTVSPSGRVTTGTGYAFGPWGVYYSHEWGPLAIDNLSVSRTLRVASRTTASGSIGAMGEAMLDGTYHVSPSLALQTTYNGTDAILTAGGTYAPLLASSWSASIAAFTRRTQPVGLSATALLSPNGFSASFQAKETPLSAVDLLQSLSYQDKNGFNAQLVAAYQGTSSQPDVFGLANMSFVDGMLSGSGAISASITRLPWIAAIRLQADPQVSVAYGQTYLAPSYSISGSIAVPLHPNAGVLVGGRAAYNVDGATVGAGASYNFLTSDYGVSGSLSVPFTPSVSIQGALGYESSGGVSWTVGAVATVHGAFALPNPIVQAFGGVDLGTITGLVLQDRHGDVTPAANVTVAIPALHKAVKTDDKGAYHFVVTPGTYTLGFPGLAARFSTPLDLSVTAKREATTRKDIKLTVSHVITGQVFDDRAHTGQATSDTRGLADVTVTIKGTNGLDQTTTGSDGTFVFRGMPSGPYEVSLVPATLPPGFVPTTKPISVKVSDSNAPFVSLGAALPKATITNTLQTSSLSLIATVSPTRVPAGALVEVSATSKRARTVSVETSSGNSVTLTRKPDGTFVGQVEIPRAARAVTTLKVVATSGTQATTQNLMVFVTNGPLATLTLEPGYADPGATVLVHAHVLTKGSSFVASMNGTETTMHESAPQTYEGTLIAPSEPGTYKVDFLIDGHTITSRTLTVTKPATSGP